MHIWYTHLIGWALCCVRIGMCRCGFSPDSPQPTDIIIATSDLPRTTHLVDSAMLVCELAWVMWCCGMPGASIEVTDENKGDYIEARVQWMTRAQVD